MKRTNMGRTIWTFSVLTLCSCVSGPDVVEQSTWTYNDPMSSHYDSLLPSIEMLQGDAPALADGRPPTAEELRALAIYTNYKALVDVTEAGGFGRHYGPQPGVDGAVPGTEYLTVGYISETSSHTMALQVPDRFPGETPCLVAAPASGSRGVYGAVGSVGEWALRHDCAVVYTDKGAGPWVRGTGTGYTVNGLPVSDDTSVAEPYSAKPAPSDGRYGFKHANSGQNPEADWGRMTLASIEFALDMLARHHPSADQPLIIAASVSNGGAAVLRAVEEDTAGVIDGVVAGEPNVHVAVPGERFLEERGDRQRLVSMPYMEYGSRAALLEPCATLAPNYASSPWAAGQFAISGLLQGRCAALADSGMVTGETLPERSASARAELVKAGWHPAAQATGPMNTLLNLHGLVSAVYGSAYARTDASIMPCNLAFRTMNAANQEIAGDPVRFAGLFGTSGGLPPSADIEIVVEQPDGPTRLTMARGASGAADYGFSPLHCIRQLWVEPGQVGDSMRASVGSTAAKASVADIPIIIVHGRADGLIWVNPSSRSYVAANWQQAGGPAQSRLRYIEVPNAQHFDTLLPTPGFDAGFVPMHLYVDRALDRLWEHLTTGRPLPSNQVVATQPRGASEQGVPALAEHHVPALDDPTASTIHWIDNTLVFKR